MQMLPIGIQNFESLRRRNYLYVDKTAVLQKLIENGERYFLSRPRRFGKSLTLSTIETMFKGKSELFEGLAAKEWVREQSKNISPVIRFDVSSLGSYANSEELNRSIIQRLGDIAEDNDLQLQAEDRSIEMLRKLIRALYKSFGSVVVLIDEYDKPILDNIGNVEKANEVREVLRSFYTTLKSCDEYLRFVFITGISRFSKMGVFSAMNNLLDISMTEQYADICGYTQTELENNFNDWLRIMGEKRQMRKEEILARLKDYYDGFSFDGVTRLYNPFSILSCFGTGEFDNYWYTSGSPSFIVEWMKGHSIDDPEQYRHMQVASDFTSSQEIERAKPTSFLYQSGYLTIEKKEDQLLTLDYPNREVLDSLSRMYLELIYRVEQFASLGSEIWKALKASNMSEIVRLYNIALKEIPYGDFSNRNEFWYRSLFLMLLRGAGIIAYAEVQTFKGRADIVIQLEAQIIVLEFKFAEKSLVVAQKLLEGRKQIESREYAESYKLDNRKVISAVIVADDEKRQAVFYQIK